MKRMFISLTVCALVLFTVACGSEDNPHRDITNVGEYDGMMLTLGCGQIVALDDGTEALLVEAIYTNNQDDPCYALSSFIVKAFQDNTELEDCSDINGNDASLIREIRRGESASVTYRFILNGQSEVEVIICEPTAEETILGQQIYRFSGKEE